jgi:hypothetical protein
MATLHSDNDAMRHLLYQLLTLHDEAVIQNDLYNTSNVDNILHRMETLILDALEEMKPNE